MNAASSRESRTALIQLFVAEILIGSVGVFVHEGGQDATTSVFFRCVFGSLFLMAWGIARGHLRGLLAERALIKAAVVSGVVLVLNWVALFAGMARSSIGVATLVYHFFPFAMLALAALFYGERTRPVDLAWTSLAFAGVVLSADPIKLFGSADASYLLGVGNPARIARVASSARWAKAPKPRPLSGIARSCSLICLRQSPKSARGVSRAGYRLVNQPTVRVRSTSSNKASRPWPSSWISALSWPVQRTITRASAVSSKSLTWVR